MPRLPLLTVAAIALTVATGACEPPANVGGPCTPWLTNRGLVDTGEEPCKEQLYFPTGATVDPDGDILYVSNGNADLRYSGGTVQAIDLQRVDCAIEYFAAGATGTFPTGGACDGLVTNGSGPTDFTAAHLGKSTSIWDGCVKNPLDPGITECDEASFILDAVRIGNFGGELVVQPRKTGSVTFPVVEGRCPPVGGPNDGGATPVAGDGGVKECTGSAGWSRRLWLPVRGDPSVTFVNVRKGAAASNGRVSLDCADDSNPDPANVPNACATQRVTVRDLHPSLNGAGIDEDTAGPIPLPPQPFGIALDEGVLSDGRTPYSRLAVSHLSSGTVTLGQMNEVSTGGQLTLINSGAFYPASTEDQPLPAEQVVFDVRGNFFPLDSTMSSGAYAVAPLNPGNAHTPWYITSTLNASVATFYVADVNVILPSLAFSLTGPFTTGSDVRELAFQADGSRGYFLEDNPPSVFTLDTRPDATAGGAPRNTVIDELTLCQGDSRIGVRQFTEPGASGAPSRTVNRVYVVCFTTNQIAVVDPDDQQLLDLIVTGRGPNDITFNFGPGLPEPKHRRGYVADFSDNTLSVIDLDRGSPTEDRVIFRVGITEPPPPVSM